MKLIALAAALALLAGGGILLMSSSAPIVQDVEVPKAQEIHYVTPAMESATASARLKPSPRLELTDLRGRPVSLGNPDGKPQFVYFVKDKCPCSVDAEPLFHDLQRAFADRVDFITITDADAKEASQWVTDMAVPFTVVSAPDASPMKRFDASASVYSALLDKGRIVKMWPGYSRDLLEDMNATLAKVAGVKEKPFDPKYAPIKRTTGCAFALSG